ncbi:MAG TPA: hypothetical protein VFN87_21990 [Solirubrobacteraceae bacterium]|nr:hypothetical protein [Solirubrobacteraceae bacterium]
MLRRNGKIILGVLGASAVLGVGVAAADPPSWAGADGPQVTRVATATTTRAGDRMQLRARDGTGMRHDRDQTRLHQRLHDGTGPRHQQQADRTGNRGADCPYRS